MPVVMKRPTRVLMTLDAVGGVWRYSVDLAHCLGAEGIECVLVGCGPVPRETQQRECDSLRNVALTWTALQLDWMAQEHSALDEVAKRLLAIAREWDVDLLHLNLPSQAAMMIDGMPVVVTSHSCVATWWAAVRRETLPPGWQWQHTLTQRGLARADVVMVPTASHGNALVQAYGPTPKLRVVPNATAMACTVNAEEPIVFAAGRWWDEAKNARTLDEAAALSRWPVVMAGALSGPNGQSVRLHHAESLGELSADSTRALMSRAAVFVSTAIYEPFGLGVVEAAVRGAALVLADIPTFRELWNGAALLVPPQDAEGFATGINLLAEDPDLRRELSARARRRAQAFSPDQQLKRVKSVYSDALAAHAPALPVAG